MMTDGWQKCRYQLDDCQNWTNDGFTLGVGRAWLGPIDADGFSTLVEVDQPICRPCLDSNPQPMDPGPYYGNPRDNPDATSIPVPRYSDVMEGL